MHVHVDRDEDEWVQVDLSEEFVISLWRVVDRLRKSTRRLLSTAKVNPHHADEAYDSLDTTVA